MLEIQSLAVIVGPGKGAISPKVRTLGIALAHLPSGAETLAMTLQYGLPGHNLGGIVIVSLEQDEPPPPPTVSPEEMYQNLLISIQEQQYEKEQILITLPPLSEFTLKTSRVVQQYPRPRHTVIPAHYRKKKSIQRYRNKTP